jgi:tetratricopeptide (TPR) repeat protein
LALEEDSLPFAATSQSAPPMSAPDPSGGRAQAEHLFQVKEMDYNPRRPFYLTLGALGVVAAGYAGYVWWQMRPAYNYSASAAAPSAAAPVAAVAPILAPAPASASKAPAATTAVLPPIQPVRPRARPRPAADPDAVRAEAQPAPPGPPIAVNARILSVDPLVDQGYRSFQKNDLAAARESYEKALLREPNNRDALLGLAAIDVRSGQLEAAEARYLKVLEIDPRDSQAVAGLVGLRGRLDPVASESRLKTLIAGQPDVPQLHFSLGNQYAVQSRWPEAQAAYFKAYAIDPANPDYAFNLAVSLDQLRQKKPALEYYERALTLSSKRAATFNPAQARARVQELSK